MEGMFTVLMWTGGAFVLLGLLITLGQLSDALRRIEFLEEQALSNRKYLDEVVASMREEMRTHDQAH